MSVFAGAAAALDPYDSSYRSGTASTDPAATPADAVPAVRPIAAQESGGGSTVVSTAAMRGAMRVLLLATTILAYDFNDPDAPHTSMAIRFDGEGRRADSRRAFEAAARFTPTTSTLVNLGVCYMRMASASAHRARKVELYGLSRDAMRRGGELVQDDEDQRLYGENWGHLMTNFEIEHVPFEQEEVLEAARRTSAGPLLVPLLGQKARAQSQSSS